MKEFFKQLSEERAGSLVSCTVIEGPCAGEKLLLCDGRILWQSAPDGFLGAHTEELAAVRAAGLLTLDGTRVFAERVTRGRKLVVCGGGHVAVAVIRLAKLLGFGVTVLEDRPLFAGNARAAGADLVICEAFEQALRQIPGDEDTCFVIVTRGHRFDEVCLEAVLGKPSAYVGMMGSRRRTAIVRQDMVNRGFSEETVEAVHAPIGLAIGAETPEEIAVSIMAEIIGVRSTAGGNGGYSADLLAAAGRCADTGAVLATIVSRKGSAPRETGTKMLIAPDGSCVDTIGGGCVEAEVVRRARLLLAGEETCVLMRVDLTAEEAEEEGMVCGGVLEVFLERI